MSAIFHIILVRLNIEKTFVYMVSDEDYSPIFVLEAEEPFISNLKNGKTFRYIKDESELSAYVN